MSVTLFYFGVAMNLDDEIFLQEEQLFSKEDHDILQSYIPVVEGIAALIGDRKSVV